MKLHSVVFAAATASVASASLLSLRRHDRRSGSQEKNPAPITSTLNGVWFDVEVQFGDQSFFLTVDTGSSDTTIVKSGYHCISANNTELPEEECDWSPTFDVPNGFEYVQNETFGVKYGSGVSLGKVGFSNVTLAGITVPRQKVGIIDHTTDHGDGLISGILGLGYPALTSAHYGTDNSNSTEALISNRAIYDPLFVSMYKQKLVDPWYSIALERPLHNATTSPGGWLGLGQLPPVSHSNDWAIAPIEITKAIPDSYYTGNPEISLMTLTVDSVTWGKSGASKSSFKTNSTKFQAVVDSGNNLNLFPSELAESINAAFEPPAQYNEDIGGYLLDCDARAPRVGVTFDNHTFWHQAEDLISKDVSTGLCYSTVAPSAEGLGVSLQFLGDAFLRNVVSVYDFGKDEMRFAARTEDTAPTPTHTPTAATGGANTFRTNAAILSFCFGLVAFVI